MHDICSIDYWGQNILEGCPHGLLKSFDGYIYSLPLSCADFTTLRWQFCFCFKKTHTMFYIGPQIEAYMHLVCLGTYIHDSCTLNYTLIKDLTILTAVFFD